MFLLFALLTREIPIYKDSTKPINDRVDDLISKMTLEEKVGQMIQVDGRREGFEELIKSLKAGSVLGIVDDQAAAAIDVNTKESRLGIPLIIGIDAIHGHGYKSGATIFPTQLGMAATWDEEIIKKMGEVTALEMKYTGPSWTFSPVLCIARDLRWGRIDETFGEDPLLIGEFAKAMIQGYQGTNGVTNNSDKIIATAKHFAGYSETMGGRDATESDLTKRKLKTYFLPPFEVVAKNGTGSFMSGYQAIDGIPVTANKWLLRQTLRDEWKYEGFVVTDYDNVGLLVNNLKVAENDEDAAVLAVKGGNDMMMASTQFYQACLDAVNKGKLTVAEIEEHVRRILTIKFAQGLFEDNRYPDKSKQQIGLPESRALALKAAEESLVLLKNQKYLPISDIAYKKIAVVGPNADDANSQLGDWVGDQPRDLTITVLDGIKERFSGEVIYAKGAAIEPGQHEDLNKAMDAVNSADLTIVVVGDCLTYNGEFKSTATLELMGEQLDLLNAIVASGKPFIINVISGKPLIIPDSILTAAKAVTQQFNPGMLGGKAFANILFGDVQPTGRLPISYPVHVGQQPSFYNTIRGQHGENYADLTEIPYYSFGYGLTLTEFLYEGAHVDKSTYTKDEDIVLTVSVKNHGTLDGIEVVQVYLNDVITSVTWPIKELKAYKRVEIKAGEMKEIKFTIPASVCSLVNNQGERVVEPGDFEFHIGKSANDIHLRVKFAIQ